MTDALFRLQVWRLYRTYVNRCLRNAVRILSAHRVIDADGQLTEEDKKDLDRGCLSLETLALALQHLKQHYTPVALDAYVSALQLGQAPPTNAVILTFDDGFRDVYENALPLLQKHSIPFTVFLTTDFVGHKADMMTVEQVKAMAGNALVGWGAHGVTHRLLTSLPSAEAEEEIAQSLDKVAEWTGRPVSLFCYPDGAYTPAIQNMLAQRGVMGACTTGRQLNSGSIDRLALQRIPFEEEPLPRFALRVAGRT